MKSGIVTKLCPGGFFVVRYQNVDCAAFCTIDFVDLNVGDMVEAELDKVGWLVMRHVQRNEAFEVFAHTGQSGLVACLLLIENLRARTAAEERVFEMFLRDDREAEAATTLPGLFELSRPAGD
jgi:hypothetical protein